MEVEEYKGEGMHKIEEKEDSFEKELQSIDQKDHQMIQIRNSQDANLAMTQK